MQKNDFKNIKLYLGPMSLNVVKAAFKYHNKVGLIPSRRQVEYNGGYVNNWTTSEFANYIKSNFPNMILERDHGGPGQGSYEDDGLESFKEDCQYLDIIHIDPWKKYIDIQSGAEKTAELINYCYSLNPNCFYEIGTEEAIRPMTAKNLDDLVSIVKSKLSEKIFEKVVYLVVQSGTGLVGTQNTGTYSVSKLQEMNNICKKYNLLSKEHNGDFLLEENIYSRFTNGLDAINIAPEFGQIETKIYLDSLKSQPELLQSFYEICLKSEKWKKWVPKDFNPEDNKKELSIITGHYIFSSPEFLEFKPDVDLLVQQTIQNKIGSIVEK